MMMAVHEARQQDLLAGADHRHGGVLGMQIVVGADGHDHAILLQDSAVLHLVPGETILGAGDGGAAADETDGHVRLLLWRSWIMAWIMAVRPVSRKLPARRRRDQPRHAKVR